MTDAGEQAKRAMEQLTALLARYRTEEVAGQYLVYCLHRTNDLSSDGALVSPARQGDVLLSLLVATPEPGSPLEFGRKEWDRVVSLLNRAFMAYAGLFWPTDAELSDMSEEWLRVREVAMPAFLHYFNTGLVASPEQVSERVRAYLAPFDPVLEASGLPSTNSALAIASWIWPSLQAGLNRAREMVNTVSALRERFGADLEGARAFTAEHLPDHGTQLAEALRVLGKVQRESLVSRFGQAGARFWERYSVARGAGDPLVYPTDEAVGATRPMIQLSPDEAMVPAVNSLFTAILTASEQCLLGSPVRDSYLAHRDKTLV